VGLGVAVGVGVAVAIAVAVAVAVAVGVDVGVVVAVDAGVAVGVDVDAGVEVGVDVGLELAGTMAYAWVSPLWTPVPTMILSSLMPRADDEVFIDKSQPELGGIRSAKREVFVPS
jgi:hypothetical protein